MKAFVVVSVVLFLASTGVQAQGESSGRGDPSISSLARNSSYETCNLMKLERALMNCLNHEVEGIVMSALREVAKIKLAQPECESTALRDKVNELVQNGATNAIRYKAYLTAFVLAQPQQFAAEGQAVFTTDEQFYIALASNLQKAALSDAR